MTSLSMKKALLGTALAAVVGAPVTAETNDKTRLIVGYKADAEKFAGDLDYAEHISERRNLEVIEVSTEAVDAIKDTLGTHEDVRYVERDSTVSTPDPVEPDTTPRVQSLSWSDPEPPVEDGDGNALFNDPGFVQQHYWADPAMEGRAGSANVGHAFKATEIVRAPRIAIIDSGASQYPQGMEWSGGVNLVSQEDGQLGSNYDQLPPEDWAIIPKYEDEGCSSRSSRHGQQVGSLIGAPQNNSHGIAGFLPGAHIYAVRTVGCNGKGATLDIVDGILWAAGIDPDREGVTPLEKPVDVINLSLGGERECQQTQQEAIDQANEAGVTVIAGAGNDDDITPEEFSPANCDGVIAVTGVSKDGDEAGQPSLGISITTGPGADIAAQSSQVRTEDSLNPEGRDLNGTSFATPIVSAIAALIRANVPGVDPQGIRAALMQSARTPNLSEQAMDEGAEKADYGAGIADAEGAFREITGAGSAKLAELRNPLTDADCNALGQAAKQALQGVSEAPGIPRELAINHAHDRERAVLFEVTGDTPSDWTVSEALELTSTDAQRVMVDVQPDGDYGVQFCDSNDSDWECDDDALIPVDAS